MIGEVWLCSGQSNMGWSVQISDRSYQTIRDASDPSIRFFHVPNTLAWEPQDDVAARWEVCSPETVPGQSAVAYLFLKAGNLLCNGMTKRLLVCEMLLVIPQGPKLLGMTATNNRSI